MHTYRCTQIHTGIYTCAHTDLQTEIYTPAYQCTYWCTFVQTHIHTCKCTHRYKHIHACKYLCTLIYPAIYITCIHIVIHIHHIYRFIQINSRTHRHTHMCGPQYTHYISNILKMGALVLVPKTLRAHNKSYLHL